jgi:general secretion pathway protein H
MKFRQRAAGFTLIELLLVVGIMAMIAGIVLVQVVNSLDSARVASAGRDLMAALRSARGAALLQRSAQVVTFDVEKKTYQLPGREPVALPESMEIELYSATEEQLSDTTGAIRFYPDGGSTGGQVKLSIDGRSWTVQVAWLTGDIGLVDSAKERLRTR